MIFETEQQFEIEETEKSFCAMLDDLTGSEFDLQGLAEMKKMLRV